MPIVVSAYEIGASILYPGERMRQSDDGAGRHPIREAYRLYVPEPSRPADLGSDPVSFTQYAPAAITSESRHRGR